MIIKLEVIEVMIIVTPGSQNRTKSIFSEKSAGATNGVIDTP